MKCTDSDTNVCRLTQHYCDIQLMYWLIMSISLLFVFLSCSLIIILCWWRKHKIYTSRKKFDGERLVERAIDSIDGDYLWQDVFITTKMVSTKHVKCLMCDISIDGVHTKDLSSYYQIILGHLSDISFYLPFPRTQHRGYRCDHSEWKIFSVRWENISSIRQQLCFVHYEWYVAQLNCILSKNSSSIWPRWSITSQHEFKTLIYIGCKISTNCALSSCSYTLGHK